MTTVKVNGVRRAVKASPDTPLLYVFRTIAAAFFDATGKPARHIPLTPEHVKAMLED